MLNAPPSVDQSVNHGSGDRSDNLFKIRDYRHQTNRVFLLNRKYRNKKFTLYKAKLVFQRPSIYSRTSSIDENLRSIRHITKSCSHFHKIRSKINCAKIQTGWILIKPDKNDAFFL